MGENGNGEAGRGKLARLYAQGSIVEQDGVWFGSWWEGDTQHSRRLGPSTTETGLSRRQALFLLSDAMRARVTDTEAKATDADIQASRAAEFDAATIWPAVPSEGIG